MIRAIAVSRATALSDVSVEVRNGEVLCVVGPNGAGKSTLLKLLSGEWIPSSGKVELNGRAIHGWSPEARAQVLAVLPQASTLNAAFTALEVVLMSRPADRADVDIARRCLEEAEAGHLANQIYTNLSGGERQSVQLARVLAQIWRNPEANLLLDEPTANLDPAQQHRTLRLARDLASQGVAVFVIVHDLNLAAEYADRVAVLKLGRLAELGTPAQVFTPECIWQNFGYRALVLPHPKRPVPLIVSE